ncbi:MAG: histone deacetylase family protein [Oscillatoriaceae cyanobacterium Prado104]|jgi:acetoin utilization deacetylase AcuC-like enzyme|nr:histone deacetylase family protein [Oscillatoriaceae cyanobacterium Prado104]
MRAIISPYFAASGPLKMLHQGSFVEHYDVLQRGQEICSGLVDAGCSIETAALLNYQNSSCRELILSIHDAKYVDYLQNAWANWSKMQNSSAEILPNISPNRHITRFNEHPVALAGWYIGDAAAPIGEHTWRNALGSVSAVIEAASALKNGELAAYALCRPSGHHACQDMAMGMCFLNNAAIAAQLLRQQFHRVAILDIDMHHGNGAQQIFYQRDDVLTVSIHGDPSNFYPFYSGFKEETGVEQGEGFNINLPLPAETQEVAYLEALNAAGNEILDFGAGAAIVATGFDTFKEDPLGCFRLESTSYYEIGRMIRSLQLPTLFVQEGGYFVPALRENMRQLILGLGSG